LGKEKLNRFKEMKSFERLFQPKFEEISGKDYYLKGKWGQEVFHNNHPIILELGCGKGEYTINLARNFPESNFIGIDIKGARMWRGSKTSNEENILNAAFLRTRIEFINSFFSENEVSEIWITFPDPQIKDRRKKKRLTAPLFLKKYQEFLSDGGIIHLKTDSDKLYLYTLELLKFNKVEILFHTSDLYNSGIVDDILHIKTHYELIYLSSGSRINYLKFRLSGNKEINESPDMEDMQEPS
jgi:tRNA (guanine-N7-)-methyltransferase